MSEHCVCKNSCSAGFFGAALKDMRDKSCTASAKQRQEWAFEAMKLLMREEDGKLTVEKATESKRSGRVNWTLFGTPVCRPFWNWCYQVSGNTAAKLRKLVIAGAVTLPTETIPRMPTMRSKQMYRVADSWFLRIYENLAGAWSTENELDLDDGEWTNNEHAMVSQLDHPLWSQSILLNSENPERFVQKKNI